MGMSLLSGKFHQMPDFILNLYFSAKYKTIFQIVQNNLENCLQIDEIASEINPNDPSSVEFHASEIFGGI